MKKKFELTGKCISNLKILDEFKENYVGIQKNRKTIIKLKAQCKCGKIFFPYKTNVLTGKTKNCSRCSKNVCYFDKKFGFLLVLERDYSQRINSFICQCDCGWKGSIRSRLLTRGINIKCPKCRYPKKYSDKEKLS